VPSPKPPRVLCCHDRGEFSIARARRRITRRPDLADAQVSGLEGGQNLRFVRRCAPMPERSPRSRQWRYWGMAAKSESPVRGGRYVVVGPSTTKECRGWPIHDKRGPGADVPAGASGPGVTAAPALAQGSLMIKGFPAWAMEKPMIMEPDGLGAKV